MESKPGEPVIVANPLLISRELSGRMALFDPSSRACYSLDAVGLRVWELIQQPKTIRDLVEALVTEYEIDRKSCERGVSALVQELQEAKLVEVVAQE